MYEAQPRQADEHLHPTYRPAMDKIPLNYEASGGDTHKQTTTSLPQEVVQCLENARFVSSVSTPPSNAKMPSFLLFFFFDINALFFFPQKHADYTFRHEK